VAYRTLDPSTEYADKVAEKRFNAGFDIAEVQTAFNVLEEAIWRVVITQLPTEELLNWAGLIATVLGAGKDTLARRWVALATSQHVASLDLSLKVEPPECRRLKRLATGNPLSRDPCGGAAKAAQLTPYPAFPASAITEQRGWIYTGSKCRSFLPLGSLAAGWGRHLVCSGLPRKAGLTTA
jgi:hypothetical protein